MATMYLREPRFNLRSSWTTGWNADLTAKHSVPSTATEIKVFAASALPSGSVVHSAILTVDASDGYTGGTLKINNNESLAQDITNLFQTSQSGAFADFGVTFTYKANGGQGAKGSHLSVCVVKSATIEITYTVGEGAAFDQAAYRAAALANSRTIKPRGIIRYADGSKQPIDENSIVRFEINEGCDDDILLGTATSAMLEMTLANAGGEWLYGGSMRGNNPMNGAEITLEIGLSVDDQFVYTPAGTYVIDEMKGREGEPTISVSGYDQMSNALEKPFEDDLTYPATLSQILAKIVEKSGLGVSGVLMTNRVATIPKKPDWGEECTLRKAISFVCAAGGSYAYMTRDNLIGIADAWKTTPTLELTTENYMDLTLDERALVFNRLVVKPRNGKTDSDNIHAIIDANIDELPSNTLYIDDNPLFVKGQAIAATIADGIKTALTGAVWRALDVRWRGDPSVIIGTRITVTNRAESAIITSIMAQTLEWDNGFSASAICAINTNENIKAGAVTGGGMIDSKKISVESITGALIAEQAIENKHITPESIDTEQLKSGSVVADKIQSGAITTEKIAAGAITAESGIIAEAAITRAKIQEAAVGTAQIDNAAITEAKIDNAAVTNAKIANAAITEAKIDNAAITKAKIADGSITNAKIANATIETGKIKDAAITTAKIADAQITNAKIKDGEITSAKIADASITNAKIGSAAIGSANIQNAAITTGLIGTGAVNTAQIADGSITDAKIVSLTASKITAGTIDASKINVNNLTADNITTGTLNGAVIPELGTDKVADGAITGTKVADNAIAADKIVSGAVTTAKLAAEAVTANKIASNAVTADKIAANAITANKLSAGAVTAASIAANAITADKIQAGAVTVNKLASGVGSSLDITSNVAITARVTTSTYNTGMAGKLGKDEPAKGVVASHILIEDDNMEIESGGDFSLKGGANAGEYLGISSTDDTTIYTGADDATGANAKFSLSKRGEAVMSAAHVKGAVEVDGQMTFGDGVNVSFGDDAARTNFLRAMADGNALPFDMGGTGAQSREGAARNIGLFTGDSVPTGGAENEIGDRYLVVMPGSTTAANAPTLARNGYVRQKVSRQRQLKRVTSYAYVSGNQGNLPSGGTSYDGWYDTDAPIYGDLTSYTSPYCHEAAGTVTGAYNGAPWTESENGYSQGCYWRKTTTFTYQYRTYTRNVYSGVLTAPTQGTNGIRARGVKTATLTLTTNATVNAAYTLSIADSADGATNKTTVAAAAGAGTATFSLLSKIAAMYGSQKYLVVERTGDTTPVSLSAAVLSLEYYSGARRTDEFVWNGEAWRPLAVGPEYLFDEATAATVAAGTDIFNLSLPSLCNTDEYDVEFLGVAANAEMTTFRLYFNNNTTTTLYSAAVVIGTTVNGATVNTTVPPVLSMAHANNARPSYTRVRISTMGGYAHVSGQGLWEATTATIHGMFGRGYTTAVSSILVRADKPAAAGCRIKVRRV